MINNARKGFTLIEMLVVLVIVSLTIVLLTEGLSTTWRNFEKLNSENITDNHAKLSLQWFSSSVRGALLSHPERVVAEGDVFNFEFTSFLSPDGINPIPVPMAWRIKQEQQEWLLIYHNKLSNEQTIVGRYSQPIYFQFLVNGEWLSTFSSREGTLPRSVSISSDEYWIVTAIIGRPTRADIPAEWARFGKYEFGI